MACISDECYYHRKQKSYRQNTFFNIDQLTRDAVSTVANVIEGKQGSSKKDFKNFYAIALKSANETKYWICPEWDNEIVKVDK